MEAEITKGKYHDYDTFLGPEAIEYLKAYIEMKKKGTAFIPPETIADDSPIIRDEWHKKVKPISPGAIHQLMSRLYAKTNLRRPVGRKSIRYDLRAHLIRKYFRTQLGATNAIPIDYVEYWMGHTITTYDDVRMKGIDYMRNLYAQSGPSIRPRSKLSKIEQPKIMIEGWGMSPNEILSKEALAMPPYNRRGSRPAEDTDLKSSLETSNRGRAPRK